VDCVAGDAVIASGVFRSAGLVLTTPYTVTHPSYTSNVGPTARIFSRYVDVVPVGHWVVLLEMDGRLLVVVVNSQQDLVSLIISYTGNGSESVRERMCCTSRQ
jgi:hypothetical protein